MELPAKGIYCVAKASSNRKIESTALLPYPIDLSKRKAELGIKYIAVTPNWKYAHDLFVTLTDNPTRESPETEEQAEGEEDEDDDDNFIEAEEEMQVPDEHEIIKFEDIIIETCEDPTSNLRKQLEEHNGKTKNPLLKIIKHPSRKYNVFKLRENAKVKFSDGLAQLFGVDSKRPYVSRLDKAKHIPITVREDELTSSTDIYYLKNDQIQSNYLLDNKQDKIIEVLHIPGIERRDFHPILTYVGTEVNLLERLKFTLYNESNQIVTAESCDMYIICHIRPV